MPELTRFRSARAPQRRVPRDESLLCLSLATAAATPVAVPATAPVPPTQTRTLPVEQGALLGIVVRPQPLRALKLATTQDALIEGILELDRWLTGHDNAPDPKALRAHVEMLRLDPAAQVWIDLRQTLTSLFLQVLSAPPAVTPTQAAAFYAAMTRYLLVMGLVELLTSSPDALASSEAINDALRWRTIVMPSPEQLSAAGLKALTSPMDLLVRRPGFTDLFVVEQEWNRYEAGEVSYIENVLAGEEKERKFTHVDTTRQETTLETSETKFSERDLQRTDRAELHDQSSSQTQLSAHVEGKVDVSAQYGPANINTHVGGSLDYSSQQSNEHALTISQEVVSRAVNRIEEQVSESRKTINVVKNIETTRHAFKNGSDNPVVGVYRWLDRIDRARVVSYPHRYVIEFELPEPGAWYRWAHADDATRDLANPPPVPLTLSGAAEDARNPRLTAKDITADNYLVLGARYLAPGLQPPPAKRTRSVVVTHDTAQDTSADKQFLKFTTDSSLDIDAGFRASAWRAAAMTWTNYDQTGKAPVPPNWTPADDLKDGVLNDGSMFISVGASKPLVKYAYGNAGPIQTALDVKEANDVGPITTGTVPISIMTNSLNGILVNVELDCEPLPATMVKWQVETYEQIAAAYTAMKQAWLDELASRELRQGGIADGNPTLNQQTVREELKKQVLAAVTGNSFRGGKPLQWDPTGTTPPSVNLQTATATAPRLEFLEQAFEWENLSYMLYPYFWAEPKHWKELQAITGTDPEFARFLRSGSARVVVPARRGFELQVQLFLTLGVIWSGGPVPAPNDDTYLSIADEIKAMQRGATDGSPVGEAWEVRLPTTLVWLENASALPANTAARIRMPGEA